LQGKLKAQAQFEEKFSAREKEKRKDDDDDASTLRLNIPHILQKYLLSEGERVISNRPLKKGALPTHPNVSEVLSEFLTSKGSNPLENHLLSDMIQVISRKRSRSLF
jgi:hypothetical protein